MPTYLQIEKRIDSRESRFHPDDIADRWLFGCKLLKERVGKKLPAGRLQEVAGEVGKSSRDIKFRMQFAAEYPTARQMGNAVTQYGTWHQIVASGLGVRGAGGSLSPSRNYWQECVAGLETAANATQHLAALHPAECKALLQMVLGLQLEAARVRALVSDKPRLRITG